MIVQKFIMTIVQVKKYKDSTISSPKMVSNLFSNIEQILYDMNYELQIFSFIYSHVDN